MNQLWVQMAGWIMLHIWWQPFIPALSLWLANRLLRAASPRSRYACAWLALILCLAMPVISLARYIYHYEVSEDGVVRTYPVSQEKIWQWGDFSLIIVDGYMPVIQDNPTLPRMLIQKQTLPILAGVWLLVSLWLFWRFRRGWSVLVRRIANLEAAPPSVSALMEQTARRLQMTVLPECLQSEVIVSPVVMGARKPVVVVPFGFETDYSIDQQRMLLAHELAHIARGDTWRNAVQCVLELLFVWHPAALWISRCIRHEREMCCDEMAAEALGQPRELAEALAHLAAVGEVPHCMTLAANRGSVLQRVRHLIGEVLPLPLQSARLVFALLTMPLALLGAFHAHVASSPYLPWKKTKAAHAPALPASPPVSSQR